MSNEKQTPDNQQGHAPLAGVVLACPFCGSDELNLHENPSRDGTITFYKLMHGPHTECSVSFMHSNKERLIELWNSKA